MSSTARKHDCMPKPNYKPYCFFFLLDWGDPENKKWHQIARKGSFRVPRGGLKQVRPVHRISKSKSCNFVYFVCFLIICFVHFFGSSVPSDSLVALLLVLPFPFLQSFFLPTRHISLLMFSPTTTKFKSLSLDTTKTRACCVVSAHFHIHTHTAQPTPTKTVKRKKK